MTEEQQILENSLSRLESVVTSMKELLSKSGHVTESKSYMHDNLMNKSDLIRHWGVLINKDVQRYLKTVPD